MVAPVHLVPWEAPAPETAFARLQGRSGVFWLDSSLRSPAGRFSILGCEPFAVFRARGAASEFRGPGGRREAGQADPRAELERRLALYQVERDDDRPVPFCGGAVGFLGYDFGRNADNYFAAAAAEPDAHVAWHDAAAVWDHLLGRAWLVGVGWRRPPAAAVAELRGWLEAPGGAPPAGIARPVRLRGDFTAARYAAAVESVRERIAAGEIYQMNLAQRFTAPLAEPPADLYRRLRALNPAPMGAFVDAGDCAVLSSSPERFFSVAAGRIQTFPIKGTRPRGATPEADRAHAAALLASEKERAELLMIVDLLRNDLGRVCRFGTVEVRRLHDLETFATVHHLVGEVTGELRPEVGMAELLAALLPGGSITGAPKVRAMQVIAATEPVPRGVFSGAVGYWSADGRIDLAIAIRTIVCRGEEASFHVGAGIVWDSQPIMEYEETLAKGLALRAALGGTEWPA